MTLPIIQADWPAPRNVVAGTTTRVAPDGVLPPEVRYLNQVHGSVVASVATVRESPGPVDADAVVGQESGDYCAVRTADCLPVLFCAKDGSAVAAAHAGWRGLAAGVLENTVAEMGLGGADLLAWMGPAISQPNFEVGDEVRAAFLESDPAATELFEPNARERWQADLYGLARRRLSACGIEAVYGGHWCTFADAERFYSYRRAADTGRMVSFVLLK
jgi:YfiH family protein